MTDFVHDLGDSRHWVRRDAVDAGKQCRDEATYSDGVMRWTSNGRVPPKEYVDLAAHFGYPVDVTKTTAARDSERRAFLAAYRARDPQMSTEELSEARANHPPGTRLVNVITKRVTVL